MKNKLKIILCIILNLAFSTITYAGAQDFKLVLENLAKVKHINAEFEETKSINMLENKIKLAGLLEYRAPDSLSKQTLQPTSELFVVKGNDLHIKNAAGEETDLLLTNYPVVEMFVEAYRGLLAGNLKKLRDYYEVQFTGNIKHWTITLTPIEEEALELISIITAEGIGENIHKVTVNEANGDSSVMQIKNTQDGA